MSHRRDKKSSQPSDDASGVCLSGTTLVCGPSSGGNYHATSIESKKARTFRPRPAQPQDSLSSRAGRRPLRQSRHRLVRGGFHNPRACRLIYDSRRYHQTRLRFSSNCELKRRVSINIEFQFFVVHSNWFRHLRFSPTKIARNPTGR